MIIFRYKCLDIIVFKHSNQYLAIITMKIKLLSSKTSKFPMILKQIISNLIRNKELYYLLKKI